MISEFLDALDGRKPGRPVGSKSGGTQITGNFVIEDDVPLPSATVFGRNAGELHNTLMQMKVGQSVFVPNKHQRQCSGTISAVKRKGRNFTTRAENGGTRIWCLESPHDESAT